MKYRNKIGFQLCFFWPHLELGEKFLTGVEILPNESSFEALEELRNLRELWIHLSLSLSELSRFPCAIPACVFALFSRNRTLTKIQTYHSEKAVQSLHDLESLGTVSE